MSVDSQVGANRELRVAHELCRSRDAVLVDRERADRVLERLLELVVQELQQSTTTENPVKFEDLLEHLKSMVGQEPQWNSKSTLIDDSCSGHRRISHERRQPRCKSDLRERIETIAWKKTMGSTRGSGDSYKRRALPHKPHIRSIPRHTATQRTADGYNRVL